MDFDFFEDKITIYNNIPAKANTPMQYGFRYVLDKVCKIDTVSQKLNGTTTQFVNGDTVITENIGQYRPPTDMLGEDVVNYTDFGYYAIPELYRRQYWTFAPQDFIVYGEVDDIVTNAQEFSALKQKYKYSGMIIANVADNRVGLDIDNVEATSV